MFLFDADTFVVNPHTGRYLRGFQDQLARRMIGRLPWKSLNGRWENTFVEAERTEVGFEMM